MMIIRPKIKVDNFKKFFKGLPRTAAEHAFLTFLILFFLASVFSSFLFYKYSVLAKTAEFEISEESIKFQENLYRKILKEWQSRQERFEGTELKKYPDPFK